MDLHSFAVLPFTSASSDPRSIYFAENLPDGIARALSRAPGVSVIARSSVASYREDGRDARRIGRELGVEGLVQGTIEPIGSRIEVTVRLRHVPTDSLLWTRRFTRSSRDRHLIPFDISRALARSVRGTAGAGLRAPHRTNVAALEAYDRGRHHWNRRTSQDLRLALEAFQLATRLDSTFALAWVGLADSYGLLPQYDVVDVDEVMRHAQDVAHRAIELDTTLAEAYASLGNIEKSWTFDWSAAESLYRKAIALDPSYATAHHWHAVLQVWRGDIAGGLAEIDRASQLDPRSPIIHLTLARISYLSRNYPRAIREYQFTLDLDAKRSSAWRGLSDAYFRQGRIREASTAWERSLAAMPESLGLRPGPVLASQEAFLLRRLAGMRRMADAGLLSPADLAAAYANLGRKDEAFALLERARMDELVYGDLRALPDYDELRGDPRFEALQSRVRRRQSS